MAKSSSSHRWLREHETDPYVKLAKRSGFRSRSAFKLLEINTRDRLLRKGIKVIDLGAAPGGWSQVAAEAVTPRGQVVAVDLLPMDAIPGVTVVEGDFSAAHTVQRVMEIIGFSKVDLILSDLTPNLSGIRSIDQPRIMALGDGVYCFAEQVLNHGGDLLIKLFYGDGFEAFIQCMGKSFKSLNVRKPGASRDRSNEVYLVGRSFRH
ncbi:MAG: RlmE family RNA methyltransferase [Gammaproteobacteria bacterium]